MGSIVWLTNRALVVAMVVGMCTGTALAAQSPDACWLNCITSEFDLDHGFESMPLQVAAAAGVIVVTQLDGPPVVFDRTGGFLTRLAPPSDSEWIRPMGVFAAADSVVILDPVAGYAAVYDSELLHRRTVAIPQGLVRGYAHDWPDEVLVTGHMPVPEMVGHGLHAVSFAGARIGHLRSVGAGRVDLRPGEWLRPWVMAATGDSRVFASPSDQRTIQTVDPRSGSSLNTVTLDTLETAWNDHEKTRGERPPPPPFIDALVPAGNGAVRVVARVPRKGWEAASDRVSVVDEPSAFYRTVAHLLDLDSGRVRSSETSDALVVTVLDPERIVFTERQDDHHRLTVGTVEPPDRIDAGGFVGLTASGGEG